MGSIEPLFVSNAHYKMRLTTAIVISFLNVILYHSTQARFTEEQIENLAFNLLNPCERAIWSCCQSDRPDFAQPTFCFEQWMLWTPMAWTKCLLSTTDQLNWCHFGKHKGSNPTQGSHSRRRIYSHS